MFDGSGTPRKPKERAEARLLREQGMPIKRIAARLGVSPSSALYWTRDIKLTPEQRLHNAKGPLGPQNPERIKQRADAIRRSSSVRRTGYQASGRDHARRGDLLHLAGCMLYWAEGGKGRNTIRVL